ncbi:MAG: hypothetical protein AB8I08_37500 [Sandaracinaceae bacterium]
MRGCIVLLVGSLLFTACDDEVGMDAGGSDAALDASEDLDSGSDAGRSEDAGTLDAGPIDAGDTDARVVIPTCPEGDRYSPTSAAELSDEANAGRTAVIEASFDCEGCVLAAGQTVEAAGGVVSGADIDLNGACIVDSFQPLFSGGVRFAALYDRTRLSPELFGAVGDGVAADDAAIDALVINSALAIGREGARYVKNAESRFTRSGVFDWDMGGAVVVTTDDAALSHGSEPENQNRYLFLFDGPSPVIRNGEFDGGDEASRLFYVRDSPSFVFEDLHVHDYFAPPGAYVRGIAFLLKPAPTEHGFTSGVIRDTRIEHVGAASNGVANDAPFGVSKAIWVSVADNGAGTITIERVTVDDIYGDDAEGFYNSPGFGSAYNYQDSELSVLIADSTFTACQRRALKINASNTTVRDNVFESAMNDWEFTGAQAAMLQVFSIRGGQPIEDVVITGNEVRVVGEARNTLFAINDANDCAIENNVFEYNRIVAQSSITFAVASTQGGLYSGDLSSTVRFQNNEIINAYLQLAPVYDPIDGGPVVSGNTQRLTLDGDNPNVYWAALRLSSISGQSQRFTLENHQVFCDISSTSGLTLYGGVFNTQGAEPRDLTLRNVDITYTGSVSPLRVFAYTGRNSVNVDFDSSNRIEDCDVSGASGTGAVVVPGADRSVQIVNSFGDGATPLTVSGG